MEEPQKLDDADLEEGEIESDDGDEVIIVAPTKPFIEETVSKRQQRQSSPSPTPAPPPPPAAQKSAALKRPRATTTKDASPAPANPAPIEPTSRKEKKAQKRANDASRGNEGNFKRAQYIRKQTISNRISYVQTTGWEALNSP